MQNQALMKLPEQILVEYFERKKSQKLGYSLRALARDLERSPAFISQIFSGKRRLPKDLFASVAKILEMDALARQQLSAALVMHSDLPDEVKADFKTNFEKNADGVIYAQFSESTKTDFEVLKQWYYIAILDLASLASFKPEVEWVAKKLKLSNYQTRTAVDELFQHGLLVNENGTWKKTKFMLRFSTKASKEGVRRFHSQMMEKAQEALKTATDQASFERRLISGHMIATNPENVEKAKVRLAEMMFELSEILSQGECREVYHLGCQLMPVTSSEEES